MTAYKEQQTTVVFPDAAAPTPRSISVAADGIAARLRGLAERPRSLSVRDVIDRHMAAYAGRDPSIITRLGTWQAVLGDFTLEKLDADVIHAARSELAATQKGRAQYRGWRQTQNSALQADNGRAA